MIMEADHFASFYPSLRDAPGTRKDGESVENSVETDLLEETMKMSRAKRSWNGKKSQIG